eukprot:gene1306-biopygen1126
MNTRLTLLTQALRQAAADGDARGSVVFDHQLPAAVAVELARRVGQALHLLVAAQALETLTDRRRGHRLQPQALDGL